MRVRGAAILLLVVACALSAAGLIERSVGVGGGADRTTVIQQNEDAATSLAVLSGVERSSEPWKRSPEWNLWGSVVLGVGLVVAARCTVLAGADPGTRAGATIRRGAPPRAPPCTRSSLLRLT
jgi:hypothetical protein